jgi:hypothetical protein
MVLAVRSASVVSLGWFLYWIGYDVVVWGKPLIRVNPVNYFGAVLSLAVMSAGFRLRPKKLVGASGDGQDKKRRTVVQKASVGVEAHVVERCGEREESSVLYDLEGEESSILQGLEEEERSSAQEKQDMLALRERLEFETRAKVEVRKRNVDALKVEVADLKRQVEELKARLKAMQ